MLGLVIPSKAQVERLEETVVSFLRQCPPAGMMDLAFLDALPDHHPGGELATSTRGSWRQATRMSGWHLLLASLAGISCWQVVPGKSCRASRAGQVVPCERTRGRLWSRPRGAELPAIGASPSGKATVFGTVIPRFESWRPSQYINRLAGRYRPLPSRSIFAVPTRDPALFRGGGIGATAIAACCLPRLKPPGSRGAAPRRAGAGPRALATAGYAIRRRSGAWGGHGLSPPRNRMQAAAHGDRAWRLSAALSPETDREPRKWWLSPFSMPIFHRRGAP